MATVTLSYHEPSYVFKRRIFVLKENIPLRIGRCHTNETFSSNNALFDSKNPSISHNHAHLILFDSKIHIKDYSVNGTFVNGKRIAQSELHQIDAGDVIQIGDQCQYKVFRYEPVRFKVRFSSEEDFRFKDLIDEKYSLPLHFYLKPPTTEVELSLIVDKTEQRFKVLKVFEKFGEIEMRKFNEISVILNKIRDEYEDYCNLITGTFDSLKDEYNWLEIDNITHHILCIGFCRYLHLRQWFIKQESKLLFTKWNCLNDLEKVDFLNSCQIPYQRVDSREKKNLHKKYPDFLKANIDLLKIYFAEVLNLISSKDYLLINGYVYVPMNIMFMAAIVKFENLIENKLKNINDKLHVIADEKRIYSIIRYVEKQFLPLNFQPASTIVSSTMIDQLSDQSFPLCMNILNYYLNKKHHLRNGGRFQYGLFLKGIGVTLSESLKFWKNHFTKIMDENQFNREYSYHIRHIYGTVGKMFSYPPKDCDKILKDKPAPSEYHGCPFNTLDYDRIMFELRRNNISEKECMEIWALMSNGVAQVACTRYFNIIHKSSEDLITHPNRYFERSRNLKIDSCLRSKSIANNASICSDCGPDW